jgi:hypothetical protein
LSDASSSQPKSIGIISNGQAEASLIRPIDPTANVNKLILAKGVIVFIFGVEAIPDYSLN